MEYMSTVLVPRFPNAQARIDQLARKMGMEMGRYLRVDGARELRKRQSPPSEYRVVEER